MGARGRRLSLRFEWMGARAAVELEAKMKVNVDNGGEGFAHGAYGVECMGLLTEKRLSGLGLIPDMAA